MRRAGQSKNLQPQGRTREEGRKNLRLKAEENHREENGISNRQNYPTFIPPLTPGAGLDSEAFWKTFHECSGKLPRKVARVFLLREVDDVSTEEICALLDIRPNHLWVMLHRARLALRACLEANWFAPQEGKS